VATGSTDSFQIARVGASTPIGLTAAASYSAVRAGLVAFTETSHRSSAGDPIRVSSLTGVPPTATRRDRMTLLSRLALADLVREWEPKALRTLGLFVGLPEDVIDRRYDALAFVRGLAGLVAAAVEVPCPVARGYERGRSAFFFALEGAITALHANECDGAIVGSVDSLCAAETLETLDTSRRLLGVVSSDGVIPGEGSAFLLLTASRVADGEGSRVISVSTGREAHHFGTDTVNTAHGMSDVLRTIRQHPAVRGRRVDLLFTCETGERFWTDELAMAYLRNAALMPEPFSRTTMGQAFGDAGAGAGSLQFTMGLQASERRRNARRPCLMLVCGASDNGHLGACLVEGAAVTPDRRFE
jgi:3-oxoacyl-[acyl-carrier-protein] synthase I